MKVMMDSIIRRLRTRSALIGLAALAGLLGLAAPHAVVSAADKGKIASAWLEGQVRVDGVGGEWKELIPFVKKSPFSIAVANDGSNVYVALDTGTEGAVTQMLSQGLIVWLDPAGGKKKRFGIKFPVGMTGGERGRGGSGRGEPPPGGEWAGGAPPQPGGRQGGRTGGPGFGMSAAAMWERAEADGLFEQFEILGPDNSRRIVSASTADPIGVGIRWAEGVLFYELKVPIARIDEIVGLGVQPGAVIGIGLETPVVEVPEGRQGARGGPGGGMAGGMGGGMGGRGGGMGGMGGGMGGPGGMGGSGGPGGGRGSGIEPLKQWTTIRLAAAPGTGSQSPVDSRGVAAASVPRSGVVRQAAR